MLSIIVSTPSGKADRLYLFLGGGGQLVVNRQLCVVELEYIYLQLKG